MSNRKYLPIAAGLAAVIAVVIAATSLGGSTRSTASADPAAMRGPMGQGQATPQGGYAGAVPGMQGRGDGGRQGGPPGFGSPVTGTAAAKAKAAATARYQGTVEAVMQLPDGSYVVHVITSGGEVHVLVSKDFKVTGVDQRGPGGPTAGMQGQQGMPQDGTPPQGGAAAPGTSTT